MPISKVPFKQEGCLLLWPDKTDCLCCTVAAKWMFVNEDRSVMMRCCGKDRHMDWAEALAVNAVTPRERTKEQS